MKNGSMEIELLSFFRLIFLNLNNEQCLRQIAQRRNEQLERAAFDTEAMFIHVTKFFEAPEASEGLNILEFSGKV